MIDICCDDDHFMTQRIFTWSQVIIMWEVTTHVESLHIYVHLSIYLSGIRILSPRVDLVCEI